MNGIAKRIFPSDEQLECEHLLGYYSNDVGIICGLLRKDIINIQFVHKTIFQFCPLCGGHLDIRPEKEAKP